MSRQEKSEMIGEVLSKSAVSPSLRAATVHTLNLFNGERVVLFLNFFSIPATYFMKDPLNQL